VLGSPDRLGHVRADRPHGLTRDLAKAATEFFVRHLGNDPHAPVDHSDPGLMSTVDLQCTRSGQVRLDNPDARQVFELNRERSAFLRSIRSSTPEQWLTERVHAHRRPPREFFPRWQPPETYRISGLDLVSRKVIWWSERDVLNAGVLVRPARDPVRAVEIALFNDGTAELADRTGWLAERVGAGIGVFAIDVRGIGALAPHTINPFPREENYGTVYKLMTDLMWIGDSLAAARVFDILRAAEFAAHEREISPSGQPIQFFGAGQGAFLGYLAAAIEPLIIRTELESPPLNPESIVNTRLHGPQSNWQHVIPGMAVHCTLDDLLPCFNGRDLHTAPVTDMTAVSDPLPGS
jgi:hypothetical protein